MSVLVDKYNDLSNIFMDKMNISKHPKIKKCNFKGCKEIMDLANRIECNKCHIFHCMSHRVYEAHDCKVFELEQKKQENSLDKMRKKMEIQNKLIADLKKEYIK